MKILSKSNHYLVAAIDLGIVYSRYGFSLKHRWGKVMAHVWDGGRLLTNKVPTYLLLKKDFSEAFFGYDAENKYLELISEDCHNDFYFFKNFTSILYQGDVVKRHALCYDVTGKPLEARLVFEHTIRYFKKCLLQGIEKGFVCVQDDDFEYVFTVPAIEGESTKMLMREAAINKWPLIAW